MEIKLITKEKLELEEESIYKSRKGVLLGCSTQIDILHLRELGKTYEQIDLILQVPTGSSEYTIRHERGE